MLAVTKYPKDYLKVCRARMDAQLAAYKTVSSAAGKASPATVRTALGSFEPMLFNNLTLVLEQSFVHRLRANEGKDGNPMNEVRMLCASLLTNKGVLAADKAIKYKPETSVLGLAIGDEIRIDEKQFRRLSKAFFDAIEKSFT